MSIVPSKEMPGKPSSEAAHTVAISAENLGALYLQLFGVDHDFFSRLCDLAVNPNKPAITPFPTKFKVEQGKVVVDWFYPGAHR
jgi:hypothetical protein